jgi:hypothetical protein
MACFVPGVIELLLTKHYCDRLLATFRKAFLMEMDLCFSRDEPYVPYLWPTVS